MNRLSKLSSKFKSKDVEVYKYIKSTDEYVFVCDMEFERNLLESIEEMLNRDNHVINIFNDNLYVTIENVNGFDLKASAIKR